MIILVDDSGWVSCRTLKELKRIEESLKLNQYEIMINNDVYKIIYLNQISRLEVVHIYRSFYAVNSDFRLEISPPEIMNFLSFGRLELINNQLFILGPFESFQSGGRPHIRMEKQ